MENLVWLKFTQQTFAAPVPRGMVASPQKIFPGYSFFYLLFMYTLIAFNKILSNILASTHMVIAFAFAALCACAIA